MQRAKAAGGDLRLSLKMISAALGVSQSHLGQVFRRQTGSTFRMYLRAVRMLRAVSLLRESDLGVKTCAAILGYPNEANFCRDFRAAFGLSPMNYCRYKSCGE
jgi:AraC-like DNA-binding protein